MVSEVRIREKRRQPNWAAFIVLVFSAVPCMLCGGGGE